jgi:hypothetical protein
MSALRWPSEVITNRRRSAAIVAVVVAVAAAVIGALVYYLEAPRFNIVALELGGHGRPYPPLAPTASALRWDFVFIAGYGIALLLGTWLIAPWVAKTATAKKIVNAGRAVAVVAIAAGLAGNRVLGWGIGHRSLSSGWRGLLLGAASTSAVIKFCALLPAGAVAREPNESVGASLRIFLWDAAGNNRGARLATPVRSGCSKAELYGTYRFGTMS